MKTVFALTFMLIIPAALATFSDEGPEERFLRSLKKTKKIKITVTNQSYMQPFSPFFVMVHNRNADPLYTMGMPASDELALLAEGGDPSELVTKFSDADGVLSAAAVAPSESGPLMGGQSREIEVEINTEFPLVTVATMAINTNDCFLAVNGQFLFPGRVLDLNGLDAGSEANDENCPNIPGPVCAGVTDEIDNGITTAEGFVHVHRGIQGVGSIPNSDEVDWRNPMMRVSVSAE